MDCPQLNLVAHDLIKTALNPDQMRALLLHLERSQPGTLAFLENELQAFALRL